MTKDVMSATQNALWNVISGSNRLAEDPQIVRSHTSTKMIHVDAMSSHIWKALMNLTWRLK